MTQTAQPQDVREYSSFNREAEKGILGCILLDNTNYFEVTEQLSVTDFYLDSHRRIFAAIAAMMEEHTQVDIITLSEEISRREELGAIGGVAYLASLTEGLPRRSNPKSYAEIVLKKARCRRLAQLGNSIIDRAETETSDPEELLADIHHSALELSAEAPKQVQSSAEIMPIVLEEIEAQRKIDATKKTIGYTTGLDPLDLLTHGLYPNEYTIISGDSGRGKTAFATQITIANLLKGTPVLWFSLEMTKVQLLRRCFAPMSEFLRAKDIRDPRCLNITSYQELKKVGKRLAELPLWVDDDSRLSLDKMLSRARLWVKRHGGGIVVLDYLQIVEVPDARDDVQKLDRATYGWRDLAKTETGTHVIALSQNSYGEDSKGQKRLKGSSSLMQSCQNQFEIRTDDESSDAEIVVRKQREGRRGKINCRYDEDNLSFVA